MLVRQATVENCILRSLSKEDRTLLLPFLLYVDLPVHRQLSVPNRKIDHIYFIERGIASIVLTVGREKLIEAGIIGHEGMVGLPVILGTDRSPTSAIMQVAGSALQMETGRILEAMEKSATLHRTLQQYAHAFMMQTACTILANGHATIRERLARWLLMAHDRFDSDALPLTHELLSTMLGVRRSGVTATLKKFELMKFVDRRRGNIIIVDRDGLASLAGGYYGVPEREYRRLADGWPIGFLALTRNSARH
jgi:CRP-like cAMP-binding protein